MRDGTETAKGAISVPDILDLARRNAGRTRLTYASLGKALTAGGVSADVGVTDWQRSVLTQLLRQIVGDIYAVLRWQVIAEMEDRSRTAGAGWSGLAPDGGEQVFAEMSKRGLLTEFPLIEAITHRLYQHQLEQATRPPESNRWTREPTLDNPHDFFGDSIPEFSPLVRRISAYTIDRSRRTDRYGNPVLVPGEMEPALYERLHWRVAAVLRQMLADERPGQVQELDGWIEKATGETVRHSLAVAASPASSVEAARAIEDAGFLTTETISRLLKAGEVPLFEESFARLAGIRPIVLRRLLYEVDGRCFAVLARALDMDLAQASSLYVVVRSGRTGKYHEADKRNDPLQAIYSALSAADAGLVRDHWKRQPEFASALWEAETGLPDNGGNTLH